MKISNSFASTLKYLSPSQLSTTWRGRHITYAFLGAMSIGLVVFIATRFFFPTSSSSLPNTPSSKTPRKQVRQKIPATPASIRTKKQESISGNEEVLKRSCVFSNHYPLLDQGVLTIEDSQESTATSLSQIFKPDSVIYVADRVVTVDNLKESLKQENSTETFQDQIINFLLQLESTGKKALKHLYPESSATLDPNSVIDCSISKNDAGQPMMVLNKLCYADKTSKYQLYLIAMQMFGTTLSDTNWKGLCCINA